MEQASLVSGRSNWLVGADIGGTFTDVVAVAPANGERRTAKVLTTPDDPIVGVIDGIERARHESFEWSDIAEIVHGTTLAINTLVERKGPSVGLLTTHGFRDVLETGNANRYDIYDLQIEEQRPVVPRRRRLGILERTDARGNVVVPLSAESVHAAVDTLERAGVESIAICFLHAYASDVNERAAAEIVAARLPGAHLSLSSAVAPIIREYERTVATVVNAYVGPVIVSYLSRLRSELAARGFMGTLEIMKSDGGTCLVEEAAARPVQILESGPAAGALATAAVASTTGQPIALAFDMGGTTAKACLIKDGRPLITEELEVSRRARLKKGSGLPVRIASVDLVEIGTGGGSIASIGELELMTVGPQSAGSVPGPACYGRGGDRPTVTDADLLLGYLDPAAFAGGTLALDPDASTRAMRERLGGATDAVTETAWAIHDLANESMALAIRLHCVEHGVDPVSVTLVATGGAGPVHAAHVMAKLGARHLICAPDAGVASAGGLLVAPTSLELTVTEVRLLASLSATEIGERMGALASRARASREDAQSFVVTAWLHMRRKGQGHEIRVEAGDDLEPEALEAAFRSRYRDLYGRTPASAPVEVVSWSVSLARARDAAPVSRPVATANDPGTTRPLYFGAALGWVDTPEVVRASIVADPRSGPFVVQEAATSIIVPPGMTVRRDARNNVHVEVER